MKVTQDADEVCESSRDLTPSDAHMLLSSMRRREAFRIIVSRGSITKRELVREVSEIEFGKPIQQITSQERKRVHVALYQSHIPKLEEYGVIDVERDVYTAAENASYVLEFDHKISSGSTGDIGSVLNKTAILFSR